jgi:hypothetical protein
VEPRRRRAFNPVLARAGDKVVDITVNASAVLTSVVHRVTFARKRLVLVLLWPNKADLEFLVGLVAEGKLWTVLDSRFPLCRVSGGVGEERRRARHPQGCHRDGRLICHMLVCSRTNRVAWTFILV